MKLIKELKNRLFLTILNFILLFNISYYYKNILLFFLIEHIAASESINLYLIYTDISELFNIYFGLVYLLTNNLSSHYLFYHSLMFVNSALYKKEYKSINIIFISFSAINLFVLIIVVTLLYPYLWKLFQWFQKNFVFELLNFEIKIKEYYETLLNIHNYCKYITFGVLLAIIGLKYHIKKGTMIKLRKISLFILFLLLQGTNELITQLVLYFLIMLCYEWCILLLTYLRIRRFQRVG